MSAPGKAKGELESPRSGSKSKANSPAYSPRKTINTEAQ